METQILFENGKVVENLFLVRGYNNKAHSVSNFTPKNMVECYLGVKIGGTIFDFETGKQLSVKGNTEVRCVIFSESFITESGRKLSLARLFEDKQKFVVLWDREPQSYEQVHRLGNLAAA